MSSYQFTSADRDSQGFITPNRAIDPIDHQPIGLPASVISPAQQPSARSVPPRVLIAALICGLLLTIALIVLISRIVPDAPRPAPAATVAAPPSPAVTPAPTAAAALPRSVVAFAAPNGDVLGPIDAGRAYSFTGRYGDGWVQIDAGGASGRVWVRRADLAIDASDEQAIERTPDLAPPPTPMPRTEDPGLRAESGAAAPSVLSPQSPSLAQATSEPEVCIATDFGRRCGPASAMQDQQRIASEIATASREYSQSWLATATAEAGK